MLCQQLMKRQVACVSTADTVLAAAARMRDENIGFLPVCDDGGRVVGALTDRDLATRVLADDLPASTRVDAVMTPDVVSCAPTDDVHRAEQLMGKYRKSRIICLDRDGKPAGVISLSDIVHYETSEQAARTMRRITQREVHP